MHQAIEPVAGYCSPFWKQMLYHGTILITFGLAWIVAILSPAVMTLLRLQPCLLSSASFIRYQKEDGKPKLVRVYTAVYGRSAPAAGLQQDAEATCQFVRAQGYWYMYNPASGNFEKLPRMPSDLPDQVQKATEALIAIDLGGQWADFNPPGSWPRQRRITMYGANTMHIPKPIFFNLMLRELTSPFTLLPVLMMGVWMYAFEHFYFPSALLAIILVGTCLSVSLTYRQRNILVKIFAQNRLVPYVRKGYVGAAMSQRLVPGDAIVVQQGFASCDMVLLRGNCLVEDSMLSGKARQLRKSLFVPDNGKYDPEVHTSSTVLAGSAILQVWNDKDEQDECVAMVVRTGLNTAVGEMMQPIVHSRWLQGKKRLHTPMGFHCEDVAKFFLLSGLVQLIIYLALIPTFVRSNASAKSILLQLLLSVLNAAEPVLPAVLVFVRVYGLLRLRWQGIIVSDTQKMLTAGHLDIMLFDKTGTLTVDQGRLHGIIACEKGKLAGLKTEAVAWSPDVKKMLALCHDLVPLSKGHIIGRLDEKKGFTAVEASFVGRSTICLPLRDQHKETTRQVRMEVLERLEYDASSMMSGVIVRGTSSKAERAQVLIKGAPYEVSQLAEPETLPQDWGQAVWYWTALGYKVLGFVAGRICAESQQDLTKINVHNIRQHTYGMRMLGFAVISNPLRNDSTAAITELQDRGRIRTMMVTGDHYLTATAVAQATGMLNFKRSHILITQPEVVQCYKGTAKVDAPPFSEKPTSSRLISRQDNLLSAAFTAFRIPAEPGRRAGVANSRSQSLGKLDARRTEMLLSDVSGAGLSTTHIFPKPVLQSRSSGQSAQPAIATSHLFTQMRSKEANLQEKRSAGAGVFASHMVRARSSEPYLLHQLTTQADSDALCHLQPLAAAEADARQEKLQFILVEEGRFTQLLPGQAFAMIAEGRQCIITGPVLDHLIQEAELASLEAVLQNVVVCARMRSNHKAQLLHLLSDGGLTVSSNRVLQGLGHVVGYCGDGVNDVPALQAADIGVAVGASEAVVASPVVSLSGSIMATCTLIMESRCSLAVAFTLCKYLVLYGYVVAIMDTIVKMLDSTRLAGSSTSAGTQYELHQYDAASIVVLFVSLGFICTRPSAHLHSVQLPPRLTCSIVVGPIALFMAIYAMEQSFAVVLLRHQSWYDPQESKVQTLATILLVGLSQLTVPAVSFMNDMQPHCLGLQSNPLVPFTVFVVCALGVVWVLYPFGFGSSLLYQMKLPLRFRVELLLYIAACGFILGILVRVQRQCLASYQKRCTRKVTDASCVPTSADGTVNSVPLGRQSFDGRNAVLRSTTSADLGDWVRRTGSTEGDLSSILSAY